MALNLYDPDYSYDVFSMNIENNIEAESPMYRRIRSIGLRHYEESRNTFRLHRRNIYKIPDTWRKMYCKSCESEKHKDLFRNVVPRRQMDVDDSKYQKRLRISPSLGSMDLLMETLKKPNVDINCVNRVGRSTLFIATKSERLDMVEVLLIHGAVANAPDINGDTPLHSAIQAVYSNHYISIIKLLVQYGALVDIQNNEGKSPLDVLNDEINYHEVYKTKYCLHICENLDYIKPYLTDALSAEKEQTRLASNIEQLREVMEQLTTTENSTDTKNC